MSFITRSIRSASRLSYNYATPLARVGPMTARQFHAARPVLGDSQSKKDDLMDKDSMQPQSSEYTKTGSDGGAADEDVAFDPSTTSPEAEEAHGESEQGKESALNASPANRETSKARDPKEGGAEGSTSESSHQKSNRSPTGGKSS